MNYVGERTPPLASTPYANFAAMDWILLFIDKYGGAEGDHYKQWLIDTIARIGRGTRVLVTLAEWSDESGAIVQSEYRFYLGVVSPSYTAWVEEREAAGYDWDTGCAP